MPLAVVVTGGTGALGRAIVAHLIARGDRVAVPYRGAGRFEELRRAVPAGALWGAPADLSDEEAARRFVDAAAAELGGLDGAALAAGGFAGGPSFEQAPGSDWDLMLRTNLQPVYSACRALLPHLLERGGSVVTVGARAVARGGAGAAAYVVSKAAVHALTRALALENRERGVRFNLVAPAIIDTAANRQAMPEADRARWTTPEQIAEVIAFLLSPASAPVTGAEIPVDAPVKGPTG